MARVTVKTLLLLVLVLTGLNNHWEMMPGDAPTDFFTYWIAPTYVEAGAGSGIYGAQNEIRVREFGKTPSPALDPAAASVGAEIVNFTNTQTPLLYALVGMASSGRLLADTASFNVASTIALLGGLALLCLLLGLDLDMSLLLFAIVLQAFTPLRTDVVNANIARTQLFLVVAAGYLLMRPQKWGGFAGGALLGFGLALKPSTLLAPFFLILARTAGKQWRKLAEETAGGLAGLVFGVAVGGWYFGSVSIWGEWFDRMYNLPGGLSPLISYNLALPIIVEELVGLNFSSVILVGGLVITSARFWFYAAHFAEGGSAGGGGEKGMEFKALALGLAAYLLFYKLVWVHYYLFLLPLIALALVEEANRRRLFWLFLLVLNFTYVPHELLSDLFGLSLSAMVAVTSWAAAAWLFWHATEARPGNELPSAHEEKTLF